MPTHRSRTAAPQSSSRRRGGAKQHTRHAKTGKGGAPKSAPKSSGPGHATARAKKPAAKKPARATVVGVLRRREEPFSNDPRVLEAAYRAFERLPRPRYLH
jgi:hypothetical protein